MRRCTRRPRRADKPPVISGFDRTSSCLGRTAQTRLDSGIRLRRRCARRNVETGDNANAVIRGDCPGRTRFVDDDEAGCGDASRSDRLQPVTEDAVRGFLTDARRTDRMRTGGVTSGKALRELVATPQLMRRRKRSDRRERAEGNECQGARPPTEPRQQQYQGYAHHASRATASAFGNHVIDGLQMPFHRTACESGH
jgi:hypothetical protein